MLPQRSVSRNDPCVNQREYQRYYRQRGRRHKKLTDWARQMVLQLRRWLPQRSLVLVGDGGYAVLDLSTAANRWLNPLPSQVPGQNVPLKGRRLPVPGHRVMGRGVGSLVTRRWNANCGPARSSSRWVLVRDPQGEFATQARVH